MDPGDKHYTAYVGPPALYDFMGATQFRLLCALGLRADHYLLDFGCGSLRAGRFFIGYLNAERYFGIEPNKWLIEDAITNQIGKDLINIKKPTFDYNKNLATNVFPVQFDFILAQSIFSHAGCDNIGTALRNFKDSLRPDGLMAVTFIEGMKDYDGKGWVYPDCVHYRPSTIQGFMKEVGLSATRIPWYHPMQTWYILAKNGGRLPSNSMMRHLTGVVLFDPEFAESWKTSTKNINLLKKYVRQSLPPPVRSILKRMITNRASND